MDEEHDASYKQEEGVIYNARDMAIVRAQLMGCPILLTSATPSLEMRYNVQHKGYHHARLPQRHGGSRLPTITLIDRTPYDAQTILTPPLVQALKDTRDRNEQSLLFLNRRGFAPVLFCPSCQRKVCCEQCDMGLVYHKRYQLMACHHCGVTKPFSHQCPFCHQADVLIPLGWGIEKIQEEVHRCIPEARTLVFSSDTAATPQKLTELLTQIHEHQVDIILGTQITAKGHHFSRLTCVGVVCADRGLEVCDFRAMEKTYHWIQQVAGRAGREDAPGHVWVQTEQPEHPVMEALITPEQEFWRYEYAQRQQNMWPPWGRLIALILSSADEKSLRNCVQHLSQTRPTIPGGEILGPIPAPFAFLKGKHRWRFLVKGPRNQQLHPFVSSWIAPFKKQYGRVKIQVDVDPYTFL